VILEGLLEGRESKSLSPYQFYMTISACLTLEFLAAYAARDCVTVSGNWWRLWDKLTVLWACHLVDEKGNIIIAVDVAALAILMFSCTSFVLDHGFLTGEMLVAVLVAAFDPACHDLGDLVHRRIREPGRRC